MRKQTEDLLPPDAELDRLRVQLRDALQGCTAAMRRRGRPTGRNKTALSTTLLPPARGVLDEDQVTQLREQCLLESAQPPPLPPAVVEADLLLHDVAVSGSSNNDPGQVFPHVLAFFAAREQALAWQRYQLELRAASTLTSAEDRARGLDSLSAAGAALRLEFVDCAARVHRLRRSLEEVEVNVTAAPALEAHDVRIYLRWLAHTQNCSRRAHRFLKRLRWLPYSNRYAVLKRARRFLRAAEAGDDDDEEEEEEEEEPQVDKDGEANGAEQEEKKDEEKKKQKRDRPGSRPPVLNESNARLSRTAQELLECLALPSNENENERNFDTRDVGDLHKLDGFVGRVFPRVFMSQEREFNVLTYDSALAAEDVLEEGEGRGHYVKVATWLPLVSLDPRPDDCIFPPHSDQLAEPSEDDPGLRAELGFLETRDAARAAERVKGEADSLADRLLVLESGEDIDVRTALREAAAVPKMARDDSDGDEDDNDNDDGDCDGNDGKPKPSSESNARRHLLRVLGRLRLLHSRSSLLRLRDSLNYFRAVQRQLAVEAAGFMASPGSGADEDDEEGRGGEEEDGGALCPPTNAAAKAEGQSTRPPTAADAVSWACATSPVMVRLHAQHTRPADLAHSPAVMLEARRLQTCEDRASVDEETGRLRVTDSLGVNVVYDAALVDTDQLQSELVLMGAHFVRKQEALGNSHVDRAAVLCELLESEALFQEAKVKAVQVLMNAYHHICDADERQRMARQIVALQAARPRVDLDAPYFTDSYATEIVCLDLLHRTLYDMALNQVCAYREATRRVYGALDPETSTPLDRFGYPWLPAADQNVPAVALQPNALPVALDEFVPTLCVLTRYLELLGATTKSFLHLHEPKSASEAIALQRALLQQATVEWRVLVDTEGGGPLGQQALAGSPHAGHGYVDPPQLELACVTEVEAMGSRLEDIYEREETAATRLREGMAGLQRKKEALELHTYCNAVEVLLLWNALLENLYESDLLGEVCRLQAQQLHRGAAAAHVFERQTGNLLVPHTKQGKTVPSVPSEILREAEALTGPPGRWAVASVDPSISHLSLHNLDALRNHVRLESQGGRLFLLRAALQVQVQHRVLVHTAVAVHQAALDPALQFQMAWEDDAVEQTFITLQQHEENESEHTYVRVEEQRRRLELVKAGLDAKLAEASRHVMALSQRVQTRLDQLTVSFERQTSALYKTESRTAEQLTDDLKRVKLGLIKSYSVGVAEDVRAEALLPQVISLLKELRVLAQQLPEGRSPFTLGEATLTDEERELLGPSASSTTAATTTTTTTTTTAAKGERSDQSAVFEERRARLQKPFKDDGQLENPWHLPHPDEMIYLLPTVRASSLVLLVQAWTATRDIAFLSVQRACLLPGTHSVKGASARKGRLVQPEERWEAVAHDLGKLAYETTSAAAHDFGTGSTVRLFWQKRRLAVHSLVLGLRNAVDVLLSTGRTAAARSMRVAVRLLSEPEPRLDAFLTHTDPQPVHCSPGLVTAATRTRTRASTLSAVLQELRQRPDVNGRYKWYWRPGDKPTETTKLLATLPGPGPVWGPYLGAVPRPVDLRPQLLALNEAEKTYTHGAVMEVELAIDDAVVSDSGGAGVIITTKEQHDYTLAALACLSLRDALAARLLGARFAEPQTAADAASALEAYGNAVLGRTSELLRVRVGDVFGGGPRPDAAQVGETTHGTTEEEERDLMRVLSATRKAISRSREEKLCELIVARAELEKTLLREQLRTVQGLSTQLLVEEARHDSADRGERSQPPAHAKASFADDFRRSLHSSSTRATNRAGEESLLIPVMGLELLLDSFNRSLVRWSNDEVAAKLRDSAQREASANELLRLREQDVRRMQQLLERQERSFQKRLDLSVMERNFRLVFELDKLRRRLSVKESEEEKTQLAMREEIKAEYENQLRDERLATLSAESRYAEFRESLQQTMMSQIIRAKAEMTERMVYTEGSSVEWKTGALRSLQEADSLEAAQKENSSLRKAILKLKTMYEMRDLATNTSFDKQLRAANAKLAQYGVLLDAHEEAQLQVDMLKTELVAAQSALASANSRADRIHRKMDTTRKAHQGLVASKLKISRLLEEAEARAGQFQGLDCGDVKSMMRQLQQLQNAQAAQAQRGAGVDEESHSAKRLAKELGKVKKELGKEQRLKSAAFAKLQELRAQLDPTATGDHRFWRTQYDRVYECYLDVLRQNELMCARFADLGVDPPDGVVQLSAKPAPRTNTEQKAMELETKEAELSMSMQASAQIISNATLGLQVKRPPSSASSPASPRPRTAGGARASAKGGSRPATARPASSRPRSARPQSSRQVRVVQPTLLVQPPSRSS